MFHCVSTFYHGKKLMHAKNEDAAYGNKTAELNCDSRIDSHSVRNERALGTGCGHPGLMGWRVQ